MDIGGQSLLLQLDRGAIGFGGVKHPGAIWVFHHRGEIQ